MLLLLSHLHAGGLELRSPMTNEPMGPGFFSNITLRRLINEYIEKKMKEREGRRSSVKKTR